MSESSTATPRVLRAVELRDAALKIIAKTGHNSTIGCEAHALGFEMATRNWPPELHHQLLNYGLDVWTAKEKVLNINWDDKGRIVLITFKRGDWESHLLSAVTVGTSTVH